MAKTAQEMIQRWQAAMQQAGPKWVAGTQNTTVNPMLAAIAKQQELITNWNEAVNSGRWANALSNTTMQYWKDQCKLAAQKFTMGAQKGAAKYAAFAQRAQAVYADMRGAAQAAVGPLAKATAALQVILAAGRRQGGNRFVA